jgi:ankyrin repeat protein
MSDYIHLQNSDGKSPFHLACMKKQNDVIRKLLDIKDFKWGEKNMDELIKKYKIDVTSTDHST